MPARNSLWRLLGQLRPYRGLLLSALLLTLLSSSVALAVPWFGRTLLDRAIATRDPQAVNRTFLVIGLLWLLSVGLGVLRNLVGLSLGQRAIRDIRENVIGHMLLLPVVFFDKARSGDLMTRLSSDIDQLRRTLTDDAVGSAGHIAMLLGGAFVMVSLDRRLSTVLLFLAPLVYVGHRWLAPRLRAHNRAALDSLSALLSRVGEVITNVRLVKSLGREQQETGYASRALAALLDDGLRAGRFEAAVWSGVHAAFGLVALIVVWYGTMRVLMGDLSLGTMLAYFYTLTLVSGPLASLAGVTARAQRAAAAADRVFEILDEPVEQPDPPGIPRLQVARGEIEFVDVGFAYASGPPVLAGFSLVARPGETTALVGATGAGKSTVIALLQRFYETVQGEIRIDGVAIGKVSRASLRESMAVVQQDALLFEGTIRENIRYGHLDASDAEVETAAAAAHVNEFAGRFDAGLDTMVGERGVRLSGGQRQRISIARAILRNAPILLLDEATSALDAQSETLVQDALKKLVVGRTTLVIAHRLRTVQEADRIAVLSAGRVVAVGTHQELLGSSPEYRRLQALLQSDVT